MSTDDRTLMVEALTLAARHWPHPNPRVGAIVVAPSGEIVGRGAHVAAGEPHAEAFALSEAAERSAGGTLVVTLEPCSHHGRTPPCTEAVVAGGFDRVVIGALDPDRRVAGRGVAALEAAGIDVVVGVDGVDAEALDPGYFHHRRTGRPRVTLKMAATLDGQAGAADGGSQWITSEEARSDVHGLRAVADAVLVGAGTVLLDDPRLTARGPDAPADRPIPVIVAGERALDSTARVFTRPCLVYAPTPLDLPKTVTVIDLPGPGGVDLGGVLDDLGVRGIVDLLVEGGPTIAGSLLRGGLIDRIVWYVGAAVAGGVGHPAVGGIFPSMDALRPVEIVAVDRIGPDVRIEAVVGAA